MGNGMSKQHQKALNTNAWSYQRSWNTRLEKELCQTIVTWNMLLMLWAMFWEGGNKAKIVIPKMNNGQRMWLSPWCLMSLLATFDTLVTLQVSIVEPFHKTKIHEISIKVYFLKLHIYFLNNLSARPKFVQGICQSLFLEVVHAKVYFLKNLFARPKFVK